MATETGALTRPKSGFLRDAGDGGPFLDHMLDAAFHFAESSAQHQQRLKGDVEQGIAFKEDGEGVVAAAGGELDLPYRPALHVRELHKGGIRKLAFDQADAAQGWFARFPGGHWQTSGVGLRVRAGAQS